MSSQSQQSGFRFQVLFAGAVLTALSALTALSEGTAHAAGPDIVGGQVDSQNLFSSVVSILVQNSDTSESLCTATVISNRALLTAAHCLCDATAALVPGKYLPGKTDLKLQFVSHPAYDCRKTEGQQKNDIGLVQVEGEGVTLGLPAIEMYFSSVSGETDVFVVGYGSPNLNKDPDGLRRYGVTQLLEDSGELRDVVEKIEPNAGSFYVTQPAIGRLNLSGTKVKKISSPIILMGDSGGPLLGVMRADNLQGGKLVVIGVAKSVAELPIPLSRETGFVNLFTRLDQHGNGTWVQQTLANWTKAE